MVVLKQLATPQNIDAVRASFEQSPRRSAVRHFKKLGLSEISVRRILNLDLHFHSLIYANAKVCTSL